MEANRVVLFLATASGGPWYHREYMLGCIDVVQKFRHVIHCRPMLKEGLYVEDNRDYLTAQFIASSATHLLFVDTDVGFRAKDVQALLDVDKDVVSGTYYRKFEPTTVVAGTLTGERNGDLERCLGLPGGFLLATRSAVLRAMAVVANDTYPVDDIVVTGLWVPRFNPGGVSCRDDGAFSMHCTDAGIDLWMHRGVVLTHYGHKGYRGG